MPVYVYFIDDGKVLDQSFIVALSDRNLTHADMVQEVRGQLDLSPRLHLLATRYRMALNYFEALKKPPASISTSDEIQVAFGLKENDFCPHLPILTAALAPSTAPVKKETIEDDDDDVIVVDEIGDFKAPHPPPALIDTSIVRQFGDITNPNTPSSSFNVPLNSPRFQSLNNENSPMVNSLLAAFLRQIKNGPDHPLPNGMNNDQHASRNLPKKSRKTTRVFTEIEREAQDLLKAFNLEYVINESPQNMYMMNAIKENLIDEDFYVILSNSLAAFIMSRTDKLWTPRTLIPVVEHYIAPYPNIDIGHLFGPNSFRLRNKLNHLRMMKKAQLARDLSNCLDITPTSSSASPAST